MSSSTITGVATLSLYAGLLAAYLRRRSEYALTAVVHLEGREAEAC